MISGEGLRRHRARFGAGVFCLALSLSSIPVGHSSDTRGLDLNGYRRVFNEDFANLSVSSSGPGTRWTAHTPWHGDFGDASFVDPHPGFPFGRDRGVFHIELRKMQNGKWQSGLLSTHDPAGGGFALRYGYFEMRARLPAGPGVWPGFWLDSMPPPGSPDPSVEIDVIEQYGKFPAAFNSTVTVWLKGGQAKPRSEMKINAVPSGTMSRQFHTYGVRVAPDWITFYFDRLETWRVPTPPEHTHALGILVDLGLGSGWPIDQTPSPAFMDIDYIRAYAPVSK